MTDIGELVVHYSTKAYQVRLAALTFAGAVLVASTELFGESADSNVMGTALIVVVASLSALNDRYTRSYLCACNAKAADLSARGIPASEADLRWAVFRHPNERPYRSRTARLALSWSTFGPGILGGVYLVLRNGLASVSWLGYVGLLVAALAGGMWYRLAQRDPDYALDFDGNRTSYP